jgi:hypothetical protein
MKFDTFTAALCFLLLGSTTDTAFGQNDTNVTSTGLILTDEGDFTTAANDEITIIPSETMPPSGADSVADSSAESNTGTTLADTTTTATMAPSPTVETIAPTEGGAMVTMNDTLADTNITGSDVDSTLEEETTTTGVTAPADMEMTNETMTNETSSEAGGFTPETKPPQELETDGFVCASPGEETNTDQCTQYKGGVGVKCECYYFCSGGSLVSCLETVGETGQFSCAGGDVVECFENPSTKAPTSAASVASRTFVAGALAAFVGMV